MNILDEALDGNDEKVVVFSQWERMTRIIADELDKRNIGYQYLHGGVPAKDRGKFSMVLITINHAASSFRPMRAALP
jgi:SNF2 family DNA or RNA helicase